jgi:hypothetical protein
MKKILTALYLLAAGATSLYAQHSHVTVQYDPGSVMRDHPLDFVRMRLQVAFEPEK